MDETFAMIMEMHDILLELSDKGYNEAKVNMLGKSPYKEVNDTMEILFKITDRKRKTMCLRIS